MDGIPGLWPEVTLGVREAWKQGLGKLFLTQGSPAKKKTHSKGGGIDPPIIMYVHPGTPPLNNKRKPIAPNSWLKQGLLG